MIFGAANWLWPVVGAGVVALALAAWSYLHPGASQRARIAAAGCKVAGILILLFCLLEPMIERERALPGANELLILVDDSYSLSVRESSGGRSRGEELRELASDESSWYVRAQQDFDVRSYAFGSRVTPLAGVSELSFEGRRSDLAGALAQLGKRSSEHSVAGIVLFSDGVSTTPFDAIDWSVLPPVHAVSVCSEPELDIALERVEASQTNFEESPVTVRATVASRGFDEVPIAVQLRDQSGATVETQVVASNSSQSSSVRFRTPSDLSGVHFYEVRADDSTAEVPAGADREASSANNSQWVTVDRGSGPYRVLYVCGRPNWEFKFLRRAMQGDTELELVGLIRIARREPKFTFRGADRRNSLWDGFDNRDEESAEQYDEPVLLRVGTRDEFELRGGFPTAAEDLFPYHAVVIDDLEADFFTRDQMSLLEQFVTVRGGGLLALGGEQSFVNGDYEHTPLGDMLPVYLDSEEERRARKGYELQLTREGWLEPWVRLRSTEQLERRRLQTMPAFRTLNEVGKVKPGASVLLEAKDFRGTLQPALVTQRFGKGRSAAILIGDLWRWDLGRPDPEKSDLGTAWRQLLRWLVSDVPRRVELDVDSATDPLAVALRASVRNAAFAADHGARVEIDVQPPEGEPFTLYPTASADEAGVWVGSFVPRVSGPYRFTLRAHAEDGSELGTDEAGWVAQPWARELERLDPDRDRLAEIAERTSGSVVAPDELDALIETLVSGDVPITEHELDPFWHRWWMFALAVLCLCVEWGLRRFHGLP